MPVCCRCHNDLPRHQFSRNQLSKVFEDKKCTRCVGIEQQHREDYGWNNRDFDEHSSIFHDSDDNNNNDDDDDDPGHHHHHHFHYDSSDDEGYYNYRDSSDDEDYSTSHFDPFNHVLSGGGRGRGGRGGRGRGGGEQALMAALAMLAEQAQTMEQRNEREEHEANSPTAKKRKQEEETALKDPKRATTVTNYHENFTRSHLQQDLVCPICFSEMSLEPDCHFRAQILSCAGSHMCCFTCFCNLKKSGNVSNVAKEGIPCPICREIVHAAVEVPRTFKSLIQQKLRMELGDENNKSSDQNQKNKSASSTDNTSSNNNNKKKNSKNPTTTASAAAAASSSSAATTFHDQVASAFSRVFGTTTHQHTNHNNIDDDDDDDQWATTDDDDDGTYYRRNHNNSNNGDYSRLENLTTGHINNVNLAKRCGGVVLDDTGASVIFLFKDSPRWSELERGMFVKCRVASNPRRADDLIALNVEPFE